MSTQMLMRPYTARDRKKDLEIVLKRLVLDDLKRLDEKLNSKEFNPTSFRFSFAETQTHNDLIASQKKMELAEVLERVNRRIPTPEEVEYLKRRVSKELRGR